MKNGNSNPLWYKDGIIYQVHVKAYRDKNSDGIGDFKGITEKLDYIKSLGISIIWILPFYPSPLKDDGYDTADYFDINPDYGNLDDFKEFLSEAHKRNIRVITELVLNHTSDQHPWFQRARKSPPGSPEREIYVWNDNPNKYLDARIIFKDFETSNWSWDPVAKSYYWHRFYSHQPDLNFDNPKVHALLFKAVDFWFEMGVDGLRLDAVPYLYEREGTNCENLPETHEFLKKLSSHISKKFKDKMLLAEANQWPEDAVAYFGDGDECQMAFNFPLMPRMYMAIQMETRYPIIDILEQTPEIPENCQWAMFLRNHDELTLEMVTDEERDYMYRFYAKDKRARINLGIRRRLAPLIENNRRKIELMNILLFSFPGTPIIYYGDEIGMGDNYYLGDRHGVRTPMQWSPDRNAGFSDTNPQRLYLPVIIDPEYHYEAVNVEVQERSSASLLWWMKKTISVRNNFKAFGRGSIEFLSPKNSKVLAFVRRYENEIILVVTNLSRFSQVVELDLSEYKDFVPTEVFSRNKFPMIGELYYMLTLNPYDYYWFSLSKEEESIIKQREIPEVAVKKTWKELLDKEQLEYFENDILRKYFLNARWFNAHEKIQSIRVKDKFEIKGNEQLAVLLVEINYVDKLSEIYFLPLTSSGGDFAKGILYERRDEILCHIKSGRTKKVLFNAIYEGKFRTDFLKAMKRNLKGSEGEFYFSVGKNGKKFFRDSRNFSRSEIIEDEKGFVSILYDDSKVLKIYRRVEEGAHPAVEVLRYLTEQSAYNNIPNYCGYIYYKDHTKEEITIALLKNHIGTEGTAFDYFSEAASNFVESASRNSEKPDEGKLLDTFFANMVDVQNNSLLCEQSEKMYIEMASLLGRRVGEMHKALASVEDDSSLSPENFTGFYQRSVYQSLRSLIKSVFRLLPNEKETFTGQAKEDVETLLKEEQKINNFSEKLLKLKINAKKIRIHGNLQLDQINFTGKDFIITNFEGQQSVLLSDRRLKRFPLRDIATLVWSFHSAAYSSLYKIDDSSEGSITDLELYAEQWWLCMSSSLLSSYFEVVDKTEILPNDKYILEYLMMNYLLERALANLSNAMLEGKEVDFHLKGIRHILKYFHDF